MGLRFIFEAKRCNFRKSAIIENRKNQEKRNHRSINADKIVCFPNLSFLMVLG